MLKKINKEWIIILSFALAKLVIHLLTNTNYELQRDAYLYYSLGEHLDWGFASVPPLIGLFAKIATTLFGNTTFALRLFPAIVGSISIILIARIVQELKGNIWAIVIALTAYMVSPAFLRSNTLFQPVSFNQFFWLLSGFYIIRLLKTENSKYWIYIFCLWGIAFLNKYSVAFFIVSSLLAILLTKQRHLFKSRNFILGGLIGIIVILPNIIWQQIHNWPLLHHMQELQKYQLVNVSIMGFIIDQFIMNLPGVIVWSIGLFYFLLNKNVKTYRSIALIYFFTITIILVMRGKSYYTLGLYPILFALGGYAISKTFNKFWQIATIGIAIILSCPMLPLSLPILSHEKVADYTKPTAPLTNRWEDGKIYNIPQDYADMIGWKELSEIVINHYNSLSIEEKQNCIIYAENYGQAGAISFYGKKHHLPEPICFNDSFLYWAPDSVKKQSLIYVNDEVGDIEFLFDKYEKIGEVNNPYFRENGLDVYYCTMATDTFPIFYAEKVKGLKKGFR